MPMLARNNEQRKARRKAIFDTRHLSLREAGKALGTSHQLVANLRKQMKRMGEEAFLAKEGYSRREDTVRLESIIREVFDAGGTVRDVMEKSGVAEASWVNRVAGRMGYLGCRWIHVSKVAEQYR